MNRESETFLKSLKEALNGLVSDQDRERIADEAAAHLESIESRLVAEGVDRTVAVQQALAEFGSVEEIVDGYRPKPKSKRLDAAGKWALALSFITGLKYIVLLNLIRPEWIMKLAMNDGGPFLIGAVSYALPLAAIITAMFAKRFPLGRIAVGVGVGMLLTAVVAAKDYVPHPLGGPMMASEARSSLDDFKQAPGRYWKFVKGGGRVQKQGRPADYYTFNGFRWEKAGGKFLSEESRPGSFDSSLSTMTDDQLKAEGVVLRPMLEASVNANWLQRAAAAFMWAGTFFASTMLILTAFQAVAWIFGAFLRFLLAWSRSNRVRPSVSL